VGLPSEADFDSMPPKKGRYRPLVDEDDVKEARDDLQNLIHQLRNLLAYLEGLIHLLRVCSNRDVSDPYVRQRNYEELHAFINHTVKSVVDDSDELFSDIRNRIQSSTQSYYGKPPKRFFDDF